MVRVTRKNSEQKQRIRSEPFIGDWSGTLAIVQQKLGRFERSLNGVLNKAGEKLRIIDGACKAGKRLFQPERDYLEFQGDCRLHLATDAVQVYIGKCWEQGPILQSAGGYGSFTFGWDLPELWDCLPDNCVLHCTVYCCSGVIGTDPLPLSYVGESAASYGTSDHTCADITSLSPATDDIVIVSLVWATNSGESSAGTATAPSGEGWTQVGFQEIDTGGGAYAAQVFFEKRWGYDTDDTTPTFTLSAGAATSYSASVQEVWRNGPTSGSILDTAVTWNTGTGTTATCPDATAQGDVRVVARRAFSAGVQDIDNPSEGTLAYGGGTYAGLGMSYTENESAGAVGTSTLDVAFSDDWIASTMILKSAGTVTYIGDDEAAMGTLQATYNGDALYSATELQDFGSTGFELAVSTTGGVIQTVFTFFGKSSTSRYATAKLCIDNVLERGELSP